MSASARLVVQMTPAEKNALDQRAHRANLTTSEFVRRRIGNDEIEEHRDEIEALLSVLETAAPNILKSLDQAIADANALKSFLEAKSE
jgi:hypothetical protein